MLYEYYLKDHLGNTRVIFSDTNNDDIPEILQEADYYPFGMRHQNATATNHYLYNGKELNTDLGLDWYDYGFRWLDTETTRWTTIDPLAENHTNFTPYNYVLNNPLKYTDPFGLDTLVVHAQKIASPSDWENVYTFMITLSVIENGVETGIRINTGNYGRKNAIYFVGNSSYYQDLFRGNRWYNITDNLQDVGIPLTRQIRFESYTSPSGNKHKNAIRLKYVSSTGSRRILAHRGRNSTHGSGCQVAACKLGYSTFGEIDAIGSQQALDGIRKAYDEYIESSEKKDKYGRKVQTPKKDYDFILRTHSTAPSPPTMWWNQPVEN